MTQTSKEYAEALFSLAKESGIEQEVADALSMMKDLFDQNPQYVEFLASPSIPKKERTTALEQAFQDSVPEYAMSFACVLCEQGNMHLFSDCVSEYQQMYQEIKNITVAKITSAVPLTEEEKEKLHKKLESIQKNTVTMVYSVDETILGGVIVEMDDFIMDGSLKRRLHEIKEVINR